MDRASAERSVAAANARAGGSTAPDNRGYLSEIGVRRALAVAEEAAFLWTSRPTLARSSAVTFDVLARMDERLSRIVYKLGERPLLADRFLEHHPAAFKSGFAWVTAIVALCGRVVDVVDQLLARLESAPELLSPLASALTWLDYSDVRTHVERLLAATSPAFLHLGLLASVGHRVDPGRAVDRALAADAPALRACGLEVVGRVGIKRLVPTLQAAFSDDDASCRFWSAWSAVRLGDDDGIPVLGRFAASPGALARPACDMALRALDPGRAVHAQQRLRSSVGNERLAITAAGIIGDPMLADQLFAGMESPRLARLAGAAFCLMTGCDLRRDDLDAQSPLAIAAAVTAPEPVSHDDTPTATPAPNIDSNVIEDEPDDGLPWPDVARLRQWWVGRRNAFALGTRYVAGLPIRPTEMSQVLRDGNQQQRAAAALELALLHPEAPLLDVTAPTHRQLGRSARPS